MQNGKVAVRVHELHRVVAAVRVELNGDAADAGEFVFYRVVFVSGLDRTADRGLIPGNGNTLEHGLFILLRHLAAAERLEPGTPALVAGRELFQISGPFVRGDN